MDSTKTHDPSLCDTSNEMDVKVRQPLKIDCRNPVTENDPGPLSEQN